jgi:hypothetical protein
MKSVKQKFKHINLEIKIVFNRGRVQKKQGEVGQNI